ncbi:uncharacterized protein [Ambystoma mexicanum]|uniref:uncharacterized protein n=1 Tax=Ambystoma mexicanum TaxID=8296 RepID=UPI0037E91B6C
MGTPARVRLLAMIALLIALGTLETTKAGLVGTQPSGPLGKEFITACLKNQNKGSTARFNLFVTAYHDSTSVSISVSKSNFRKEFQVKKGQTLDIPISKHLEMTNADVFDSTVLIQADKVISVLALNSEEDSSDTMVVLPMNQLGREYYAVIPSIGPEEEWNELFVASKYACTVDVDLKGDVTFKGQEYKAGSKLTVKLGPNQVIQILSHKDFSGSRIMSTALIAVASGRSCAGKGKLCNHVSEQLNPVSHWGTNFIIPALNAQGQTGIVYVGASQNTNVDYQLGSDKKSLNLVAGQVAQIEVSGESAMYLISSAPIEVFYFSAGGQAGDTPFAAYLLGITDVDNYGTSYKMLGLPKFESNNAFLIAKTLSASQITVDDKALTNVQWKPIPGCEYSWARLDFGNGFSCHTLDLPQFPFGVLSLGSSPGKAYASPGIRISAPRVEPELPLSKSTQPSGPLGLEFIITCLQNRNQKEALRFDLLVTAYFPATTVSITINKSNFKKEFVLEQGQTLSIPISKPVELLGSSTSTSSVIVKADKVISVMSLNYKGGSGDITIQPPVSECGNEYYVVTPPWGPASEWKEFSITNYQGTTKVIVYVTGDVQYKQKNYKAGSQLNIELAPFEAIQLQSKSDMSGSRIISSNPVIVVSGHSCSGEDKKCSHVSEALLPVSRWGTTFLVPSMNSYGLSSTVFVTASKNTRLEYQLDGSKMRENLKAGQVMPIELKGDVSLSISASSPIQVLCYGAGGTAEQKTIHPFLMNIPHTSYYGTSYKILGQPHSEVNYVVLIAKTPSVPAITFDSRPLPKIPWKPIPGTEYSWAKFDYGGGFSCHTIKLPDIPFGVLTFGYGDERAYGSPAIRIAAPEPPKTKPLDVSGSRPLHWLGKEFIIASPKNKEKEETRLVLLVTAVYNLTTFYVYYEKAYFYVERTLSKGQTATIPIAIPSELLGLNTYGSSIVIRSENIITVVSVTYKGNRADTVAVLPVSELGRVYYVVTPSWEAERGYSVFSIANHEHPNKFDILLKGSVEFQGKKYPAGSTLTCILEPYQSLELQSKESLSGTKIIGSHPAIVVSGHGCSGQDPASSPVSTQLLPLNRWGQTFLFPGISAEGTSGIVVVVASQTTNLQYTVGSDMKSQTLEEGQVLTFEVASSSFLSILADVGVQVSYYSTGGKVGKEAFRPYFVNILDITTYDTSYMIVSNAGLSVNFAYIIVKTSEVTTVTVDGTLLDNVKWVAMPGTDYSWAKYDLGTKPGSHVVNLPYFPFGLLTIGYSADKAFGAPAIPSSGLDLSGPLGTEFVVPIPTNLNQDEPTRIEFIVTSYYDLTPIIISCGKINFWKELNLGMGDTATVTIPIPKELLGVVTFIWSIRITSGKVISVVCVTYKGNRIETTEAVPAHDLGNEYYVLTPSAGAEGDINEISIANDQESNQLDIQLTGSVNFKGQDYPAGSKITLTLEPRQGVYIKSRDDLSGTRILLGSPAVVFSGYSSLGGKTPGRHVCTQLKPVSRWGISFLIPSMASPGQSDIVFVISYQGTDLDYQIGERRESQKVQPGQVTRIEMPESSFLIMKTSKPVQVVYYNTGAQSGGRPLKPFLVSYPDLREYSNIYQITGNANSEKNYAIFTVKTSMVSHLTFDGKPMSNTEWKSIPETGYSWAKYEYSPGPDSHTALLHQYPFGVMLVGYSQDNVFALPATSKAALSVAESPEENDFTEFSGTEPLNSMGKHFIISRPISKDKEPVVWTLIFTAYLDGTRVTCIFGKENTKKEFSLWKGQTITITVPAPQDLAEPGTLGYASVIQSNNVISLVTVTRQGSRVDTTDVLPLHLLGTKYFLVTPPGGKESDKECTLSNYKLRNKVAVYPTATVKFQGKDYPAGSQFTINLEPYQNVLLQSSKDLSGTKIEAKNPVSVVSGYRCSGPNPSCSRVSTQLLPVLLWGKTYVVPALSSPDNVGIVYIVASQRTHVQYQLGAIRKRQTLDPGEVVQLTVKRQAPLYITANHGVQVMLYSTGGQAEGKPAKPYIVNIYDVSRYDTTYKITATDKFSKNLAILTVKTSAVPKITWDGKPLPDLAWKPIPGSRYSWATYDFGSAPDSHTVKLPQNPFGLLVVRFSDDTTSVSPAPAISDLELSVPFGKDFIIPCPRNLNQNEPTRIVIFITAYDAPTTVYVLLDKANIWKPLTIEKGKTASIAIDIPKELLGLVSSAIILQADNPVSAVTVTYKGKRVITSRILPMNELGVEYYVITPSRTSKGGYEEVTITNYDSPNPVEIYANVTFTFEEKSYPPGSKLTLTMEPSQSVTLQSKDPLSGCRVVSTYRVAIVAEYSCSETDTVCQELPTQLLPVSQWGKAYIVPAMPFPGKLDTVYVIAAEDTDVKYQLGERRKRVTLVAGQCHNIEIKDHNTLVIAANNPVMALYHSSGGQMADRQFQPYLTTIPDVSKYGTTYEITSQPGTDKNFAVFIAKTNSVHDITFDSEPYANAVWRPIKGTEYAWSQYDYSSKPGRHIVELPHRPFGVLNVGYSDQSASAYFAVPTSALTFEPAPEELPVGEHPASPVGMDFVIPCTMYMKEKQPVTFQITVCSFIDQTSCSLTFDTAKFRKDITMKKGESQTISFTVPEEMLTTGEPISPIRVKTNHPVLLQVVFITGSRVETPDVAPLGQLGRKYFIVTPPGRSDSDNKECYLVNLGTPNKVVISASAPLDCQGKSYPAGSTITLILKPFEEMLLTSKENLSGTMIESINPISVYSGYTSPKTVSPPYHVSTQLVPSSRWGKRFMTPSFASPGKTDLLFVVASKPTEIEYQVGDHKQRQTLKTGQVAQIGLPSSTNVLITASEPVGLVYYCTGGKTGDQPREPFLINIPDMRQYSRIYTINANPNFEKRLLILTGKTEGIPKITLDQHPLKNVRWNEIHGSGFSAAIYDISNMPGSHTLESPSTPLGLLIVGFPKQKKTEIPELPPGEHPASPVGTDFVIPCTMYMKEKQPVTFQITVCSFIDQTSCSLTFDTAKFRKDITMKKGESQTISFTVPEEMLTTGEPISPIRVKTNHPVLLQVVFITGSRVETPDVAPLGQLGRKYFIVTPPGRSDSDNKECYLVNLGTPNKVVISPSAPLDCQGKSYPAGSTITLILKPFEEMLLTSKENLSGTMIESINPISVYSGYTSPKTVSPPYHVSTQLVPSSRWGQRFMTPSFASPGKTDLLFVVASKPTEIEYQVGDHKQRQTLKTGQVAQIGLPSSTNVLITASEPVGLVYYCTGGKTGDQPREPFLINIPDMRQYSRIYTINANPNFEKRLLILTGKTEGIPKITLDQHPLKNVRWNEIHGTGFSTAIYDISNMPGSHTLESPSTPLGLLIVGFPKQKKTEIPELPPGEHPASPVGTDFVIPCTMYMKEKQPVTFQITVCSFIDQTSCSLTFDTAKFRKDITMKKGESQTISFTVPEEMLTTGEPISPIRVKTNHPVLLQVVFITGSRVETPDVAPLGQLGRKYFIVTPPGRSDSDNKECYLVNLGTPNKVVISPSAPLDCQGKSYPAGSTITLILKPFEEMLLTSKENLSGTMIESINPISVYSGYTSPKTVSPPYHVSTQLVPSSRWGQRFMTPSFASPGKTDLLFVVASKPTEIEYQVGDHKQKQTLKIGQVAQIGLPSSTNVLITASEPVGLVYYCTGGKTGDQPREPFLINIPDMRQYSRIYTINANPNFEKRLLILTGKTEGIPKITLDQHPLKNVRWNEIHGTGFSTAIYDISNMPGSHTLESPSTPLGLLIVGFPKQKKTEIPELPPGEHPASPVGTDFVIPCTMYMKEKQPVTFQITVCSFIDQTSCSLTFDTAKFRKDITMKKGESQTISFTVPEEMLTTGEPISPIRVKTNHPVLLQVVFITGSRVETPDVAPLGQLGRKCFIVTPPGRSDSDNKECYLVNLGTPNKVVISPSAPLDCQGKSYPAGSTITLILKPFEEMLLTSKENLSGTMIESINPISVYSGYTSPKTVSPPYHVSTQLVPSSRWGQRFMTPSFASPGKTDLLFVVASKPTEIEYQVGDHKQKQTLKIGQVAQIGLPSSTNVLITASEPVGLVYYCTGGKTGDQPREPFLINIPDMRQYSRIYTINANPNFEKRLLILTGKTEGIPKITLDQHPLKNVRWNEIHGTGFSTAIYDISNMPGSHTLESPSTPLGLLIVGFPKQKKTEIPELPPGEHPASPVGTDFVIPCTMYMKEKQPVTFQITVCSFIDQTSCSLTFDTAKFRKDITMKKGESQTISFTVPEEMLTTGEPISPIRVKTNHPVLLQVVFITGSRVETPDVAPLGQLGRKYYIVTPPGRSDSDNKECYLVNLGTPNKVVISASAPLDCQGKSYPAGSTITLILKPFEEMLLTSKENLSGTMIESINPISVYSGYTSPKTVSPPYHVSTQLVPSSRWGQRFMTPSFASPGKTDLLFVVASKPTEIEYQVGDHKQRQTLKTGQVAQIGLPSSTNVLITASEPVGLVYYCTGGKTGDQPREPFLINIPDMRQYSRIYTINANPNVEKRLLILTGKTEGIPKITLDQHPLKNVRWNEIHGSGFSTAIYDISNMPGSHTLESPSTPLGLLIVGFPKQKKTEIPELPPGEHPASPVGTDFVIPCTMYMKEKQPVTFQITVCSFIDQTSCSLTFDTAKFRKDITMKKGESQTISFTVPEEMLTTGEPISPIRVKTNHPVLLQVVFITGSRVETPDVAPLGQLGRKYYIVTPPGRSDSDNKECYLVNLGTPNKVVISASAPLDCQGKSYPAGSTITLILKPFEEMLLTSKENLSGTMIESINPISVYSGYTSPKTVSPPYHVSTQLVPSSRWGQRFMTPSFASPGKTDLLFVVASKPTEIEYQVGDHKQRQTLKTGQVAQIGLPSSTNVLITASEPVGLVYYCTGGKTGDQPREPFLINIPDMRQYSRIYTINANPNFEKRLLILTGKTEGIPKITLDQHPLKNVRWNEIHGSGFSTAIYDISNMPGSHTLESPSTPLGLLIVGFPKQKKTEIPELPPGEKPSAPTGKEFFIPSPIFQNKKGSVRWELQITASEDFTQVTIVNGLTHFNRKVPMSKWQTATITLTIPAEMLKESTKSSAVIISADKPITVTSGIFFGDVAETSTASPFESLGLEYSVVTPPGKSDDDLKEISLTNYQHPNKAIINLKAPVKFQGQDYPAGSTMTINLDPYQCVTLQSKEDLSGTTVASTTPLGVSSGYSSSGKSTSYYHISTQLPPSSRWGTHYFVSSLATPGNTDLVYIVPSQSTQVDYQVGDRKQSQTLKPGQVVQIGLPASTAVSIKTNVPVLVMYYSTGGKIADQPCQPFMTYVPDISQFATNYKVIANPNYYKNLAILTAKTTAVTQITLDGQHISDIDWKPIPGTEYSYAQYDMGTKPGSHSFKLVGSPFGLMLVGYAKQSTTENPQAPTAGEKPSAPTGKEFFIPSPIFQNKKGSVRWELQITASEDFTQVTIVNGLTHFNRKVPMSKWQTATITLTIPAEMLKESTKSSAVIISADKPITVTSGIFFGDVAETSTASPFESLGLEYSVVTPPGKSDDDLKEISLTNYQHPNKAIINLKAPVKFQGQDYPAGSTMTINLDPYQCVTLQSKEDLSGTTVASTTPLGVSSGYSSSGKSTSYYHISTQLPPSSRWGTHYFVSSLATPGNTDLVYIVPSQSTQVDYQVGDRKQSQTLKPGQVVQIGLPASTAVSIKTNVPVLVMYYSTGGKIADQPCQPFMTYVPDISQFATNYKVIANPNYYKNLAILTAKTTAVTQITLDGQHISDIDWKPIPGTEYSYAQYDMGTKPGSHSFKLVGSPFGLMLVGYAKQSTIENPQAPTAGEKPSAPTGKEFFIPSPIFQNKKGSVRWELQITASEDFTQVTIVNGLTHFNRKVPMSKWQTATITLTIPAEMLKESTKSSAVIISADKPITVTSGIFFGDVAETSTASPFESLGLEYSVVTPPGKSDDDLKEISLTNYQHPNKAIINLKAPVKFQGQDYPAGSTMTINLDPYQCVTLQSKEDLSGTTVASTTPLGVSSGYSSSGKSTSYYHISTQLPPSSRWGTHYFVSSLATPGNTDLVYIVPSQSTQVDYQVGDRKQSQTLKPGQVVQIGLPASTAVSIKTNVPVLVMYYSTGGKIADQPCQPFMTYVPDISQFATNYKVIANPNYYKNLAILTAKTTAVTQITLDGQHISDIDWKPIPGTEYSYAQYDMGTKPGSHSFKLVGSPFGLMLVGYAKQSTIENPQAPTAGEKPSAPTGKEFFIPSPIFQNKKGSMRWELQITASEDFTQVTIVNGLTHFNRKVPMSKWQTATITLTIPAEMLKESTKSSAVIISADKPITVTSGIFFGDVAETSTASPFESLGLEYSVVTPPGKSDDDLKEISLTNYQHTNKAIINLKAPVKFQGQDYPAGSTMTINLDPYQCVTLQSKEDLSGTTVASTTPLGVSSGYSSSGKSTSYYHISTQLPPSSRWGTHYFVSSLATPGNTDLVYIVPSQSTQVDYQVGDRKQSQTLKPGQVVQIGLPASTAVSIKTNVPVLVMYYSTGGKIADQPCQPFMTYVPDISQFATNYKVIANPNYYKNLAILTAKTTAVTQITLDGQHISDIDWKPIPGTEYSYAQYDMGTKPGSHSFKLVGSPFGLMLVGYAKQSTIENPQAPTAEEQPAAPVGKEFVMPRPEIQSSESSVKLEFRATAYEDDTTVILLYNPASFRRELKLNKGQTAAITITIPAQLIQMDKTRSPFIVKADKSISLVTGTVSGNRAESSEIIPLQQLGSIYYVVSPPGSPVSASKVISISNYEGENPVTILVTGNVEFQGKMYAAGSTITTTLKDFQSIQLQSNDNLSGTRVNSTQPVAVSSGYSCKDTPCDPITMQLIPTSRWGTDYLVPSMAFPGHSDIVIVVASQDTVVQYQVGTSKQSQTLKAGQVLQIALPQSASVSIKASAAVMALYYSTGGEMVGRSFKPYLLNIPSTSQYGNSFKVIGNPSLEKNIAVLTVKTSDVSQITFDGKSLLNLEWNVIDGTDYSWAKYDFGTASTSHTVQLDNSSFGLVVIGYSKTTATG